MDSDSEPERGKRHSKPILVISALLFALTGIGLTALRTYRDYAPLSREFSFDKMGLFDFHNGGYQPALAFRNGVNPYSSDVCESYTVTRPAPAYSPVVFMQHLPFTLLQLKTADVVYFVFNLGLIGLLAYWSLRMSGTRFAWAPWFAILGLFVFSRPGHVTLYTGYFTTQLVIGTVVALQFGKTRPWIAALGMVLASGKPTYIIPLAIVMLARKNFRAVLIGVILCAIVAGLGIGWLASFSDIEQVIDGVKNGQQAFQEDANETPVNTWTRLDAVGVVAKIGEWKPDNRIYLICMLGLLILPCLAIWQVVDREQNSGITGLTAMIACLAILVTIYHHSYDCLLVTIPWVGVTFFGARVLPELSRMQRWLLTLLLGIPAVNYASTYKVRSLLNLENNAEIWNLATSINGFCLFVALGMLIFVALRMPQQSVSDKHRD